MTFTTSTFLNTSTAFWGVLNLLRWARRQIICNYTFFLTNLTVEARLSSVIMLRRHLVFFSSMSVCNNSFKFSNFEKLILKCLKKKFACHLSNVQTECEILLPLLLLGKPYESSIFIFIAFLLLQEGKAQKQWSHSPHNDPYLRL